MANAAAKTIYVLNGPNLNLLGIREPETYGHATLADVEKLCVEAAARFGLTADCRQSNHEGALIDHIHEAREKGVVGIVINAGGYSHTSIALQTALTAYITDGTVPDPAMRRDGSFAYPEIHLTYKGGDSRPAPMRSFGRLVTEGNYRISVTKPALFADYLTEQSSSVLEEHPPGGCRRYALS
eukprot:gene4433-biopygen3674